MHLCDAFEACVCMAFESVHYHSLFCSRILFDFELHLLEFSNPNNARKAMVDCFVVYSLICSTVAL